MDVNQKNIAGALGNFENSSRILKELYEKICAEWDDIDKALLDINHFQEIGRAHV